MNGIKRLFGVFLCLLGLHDYERVEIPPGPGDTLPPILPYKRCRRCGKMVYI